MSFVPPVLIASTLAIVLLLALLSYGASMAVSIPLVILMALSAQRFVTVAINSYEDLFAPSTLMAGYFILYFGLRTLYILYESPIGHRMGRLSYDDFLPEALWCAILGFVCFLIGFRSKLNHKWHDLQSTLSWPGAAPTGRILMTMLVGLLATAYLFKSGFGVGNYANRALAATPPSGVIIALQTGLNLGWIATCIFLLGRKRGRIQPLAGFLLALSLLFLGGKIAMTGGKQAFLEPLVEALIVYHYARRRMRLGKLVTIAVPGILVAFGLINFYRFVVVGQGGAPTSIGEVGNRVSSAADQIGSGSTGERESAFEQLMNRQTGVDALAVVMKVTPHSQPFRYGQPWMDTFIYSVIPRFVWPTKPIYSASYDFEQNYLGMPSYYIGFSSLHLISDLYRNFYLFGVAGGMFVLGLLSKALYVICGRTASRGDFGLMLYAAVLPNLFHYMEGDLGTAFSGCARLVVLALAVGYFLGVRRLKWPVRMSFGAPSRKQHVNRNAISHSFGGQISVRNIL